MKESTDATRMGMNRTGVQMSPQQTQEMLEGMEAFEVDSSAEAELADADGQAGVIRRHRTPPAAAHPPAGRTPPCPG